MSHHSRAANQCRGNRCEVERTVFYSHTSPPWYEPERKMERRTATATTVVASPRQWRIFVAYPSDSLRGLRYAFPEEVPAMKRFALIIPCPIGLSPFLAFCLQLWVMRSVRSRLSGCAYRPCIGRARSRSFALR